MPVVLRSQWQRGVSRRPANACLLGLWLQIAPGAWTFFCFECRVLSGRGLCDELIIRPEMYTARVRPQCDRKKNCAIVTVNKEKYIGILRRLRDAVRRKRPEKWRFNSWFLLHNNVPAHRLILVREFLATLNHPPHPLALVLATFYPFLRLQSVRSDIACVMLLTSLRMRRRSWKGFHKMASTNVCNTFTFADRRL
jgi:hypothetical protein